jgi:NAD(P)-dependent dehydrogenase (short-subunit alcohol dehydrogenase family)
VRIDGLVVAITGGARGIGAAIAKLAARHGARVVIGDVDHDLAARTAEQVGALALELDVTRLDSWEAFVTGVETALGPIDVLVNNAGIMPISRFVDEDPEITGRQIEVNLAGVLHGCRVVLPGMLARRRGHLINVASQAGKAGFAGGVTYCATKFGVVGLSHALDDELRDTPISVTCVLPGLVDTELSKGLPMTPFAPLVQPDEIAVAVIGAISRPRREVWVPRSGAVAITIVRMLPPRLRALLSRPVGADDAMLHADRAARAAYEERVRAPKPEQDSIA